VAALTAARQPADEATCPGRVAVEEPSDPAGNTVLWCWRGGLGPAADAGLGVKVSEDIVVPIHRLAEVIVGTREPTARRNAGSCSWGHAVDGNLQSTLCSRATTR
jgi:FAD/FMN-containing dehydrogenase